ncbi:MAG TPA: uroporphyrinogen-III C-methyltransferase [Chthoniobacterales bacterium]|nr:uroporphyrinogen-III C-methyltransferase [Chthoniobacterales bacterium]
MATEGKCVLAGAGPGDLGLVTLRAKEAIEHAEVVVYDYLCNPEILKWAPPDAEIVYAGKKAGRHTFTQAEINDLIVERARVGKQVVRLKGGDPFVFGRGGEEAEALAAAGIDFEVVPGVSAAIAVPAYAGIPITHRDVTSSFTVFTGHEDPAKPESDLDYGSLVKSGGTLVMLMGVQRLEKVVTALSAHGAEPSMAVALVRWGTTGRQETITGTLENIVDRAAGFEAPAVAVFGKVVSYRQKLRWFEKRPLFGRRIVVTRTRRQAGALSAKLLLLGADVIELPTIRIELPEDLLEFGELVRDAYQYDWLIFTSPNGVTAFFDMFFKLYQDSRNIGNVRIAAIGPGTAQRIRDYHLTVDLQPDDFIAEAVVESLRQFESVENLKFLLVRAENARDVLPKRLTQLGAIVDEAIAYRTVPETQDDTGARERFERDGADLVTFTSSSTVTNFLALKLPWPRNLRTASIGPITSETMRQAGLKVDVEANRHDIGGLVEAIVANLGR